MNPLPLVVYQCIVRGCGLRLAGIIARDGRPLWGYWGTNSLGVQRPGPTWQDNRFMDEGTVLLAEDYDFDTSERFPIRCRRHGFWTFTQIEMLEHWAEARAKGGRLVVKLDQDSREIPDPQTSSD